MERINKLPEYASCLLIDENDPSIVLLIRKNRPSWQAGKLNIIGGHVEDGESPIEAAIREVLEETGIIISDPRPFCTLITQTPSCAMVYFFVAITDIKQAKQLTDEGLEEFDTGYYEFSYSDCIPNLKYLIPLAMGKDRPFAIISESK